MNLFLNNDEADLVRYACNELANRRAEQALEGRRLHSEWAQANEQEARNYRAIADRIGEAQKDAK